MRQVARRLKDGRLELVEVPAGPAAMAMVRELLSSCCQPGHDAPLHGVPV